MPHRVFNIRDAAAYLHLTVEDVERLVKEEDIPFERSGSRVVFHRRDLDGWASRRILHLPEPKLSSYHSHSSRKVFDFSGKHALMPELIKVGHIEPELQARTVSSVIRDMVELADQTGLISDKDDLHHSIKEREKLCSTALPGGLAILHPRQHEPYMFMESFLLLGRTIQGIHFGALDGKPTRIFFMLCSQDDRLHLHILARLCTMCQQTALLDALFTASTAATMLSAIISAEQQIISRL